MLISDFIKSSISFGDAQFAIAIAIDMLYSSEVARDVLLMYGRGNIRAGQSESDWLKDRDELKSKVSKVCIKQGNVTVPTNVVKALILYISQNKIVPKIDKSSRPSRELYSLTELLREKNINLNCSVLYETACRILATNKKDSLIVTYMQTKMYKEQFHIAIKRLLKRSGSVAATNLTSDVESALADDFLRYVKSQTISSSYNNDTANPEAYLLRLPRSSDASGQFTTPLEWYKSWPKCNFFKILNTQDINADITGEKSDDEFSLLDTLAIEPEGESKDIDFYNICLKIYTASSLLFKHSTNNKKIILYDILSHYREDSLASLQEQLNSSLPQEVKVTYANAVDSVIFENVTAKQKFNHRREYCDIMKSAFENGVRPEQLYESVYTELYAKSSSCTSNSGSALLSTANTGKFKKEGNNSITFKILVEGYSALMELIDFLNSKSNKTGATVNSFPIDIFRDCTLLNRFHNIDEYVRYHEQVKCLCDEVITQGRNANIDSNGMRSNDNILLVLDSAQRIKLDKDLRLLLNNNMEIFRAALNAMERNDEPAKVFEESKQEWNSLNYDGFCFRLVDLQNERMFSDLAIAYRVADVADYLLTTVNSGYPIYLGTISYAVEYVILTMEEARRSKNATSDSCLNGMYPIIDEITHRYTVKARNLQEYDNFPSEVYDNNGNNIADKDKYRMALQLCYNILTGNTATVHSLEDCVLDWEQLRQLWCMSQILAKFLDECKYFIQSVVQTSSDLIYLAYVMAASQKRFLRLCKKISDTSELQYFYENSYEINAHVHPEVYQELGLDGITVAQNKQRVIKIAYNQLIEKLGKFAGVSQKFLDVLDRMFKDLHMPIAQKDMDTAVLEKASLEIGAITLADSGQELVAQRLQANYKYDSLGLIICKGSRFCYRSKIERIYVSYKGYEIHVNSLNNSVVRYVPLSDEIERILLSGGQ